MNWDRNIELEGNNNDIGYKDYKFVLNNPTLGLKELTHIPDGWEDEIIYEWSKEYKSVQRTRSFNDLFWTKEARDYIKDAYELIGTTAVVECTVFRYNAEIFQDEEIYRGIIDMMPYFIKETGVKAPLSDTGFAEKVRTRDENEYNLFSLKTNDGLEVTPFLKFEGNDNLILPPSVIPVDAIWEDGDGNAAPDFIEYDMEYFRHTISSYLIQSGIQKAQKVGVVEDNDATPDPKKYGLLHNVVIPTGQPTTFRIKGQFFIAGSVADVGATWILSLWVWNQFDNFHSLTQILVIDNNNPEYSDYLLFDETVILEDGYSVGFVLSASGASDVGSGAITIYTPATEIAITEDRIFEEQNVISYPIYECLLRSAQKMTDKEDCLDSPLFGRWDTPIRAYIHEGKYGNFVRGVFFRGFDRGNRVFNVSFKKLYQTLDAAFNIGAAIENDILIVDKAERFRNNTIVLDISDRIDEAEIEKSLIPEYHYNSVEIGQKKTKTEYLTGITEVNTKTIWTTVLDKVKNKYEKVAPYRFDTQGILKLRDKPADKFGNEDVKGEDEVFFIDSVRDSGKFKARTNEDFDLIEGEYLAYDQFFNLDFTPRKNFDKHGEEIRGCLEKNTGSVIRFQSKDEGTDLKLIKDGITTIENEDIPASSLAEPRVLPELFRISFPFYLEDYKKIEANRHGLIKLSETKYCWIWKLKTSGTNNKASLDGIRCNLNVVTPQI